MWWDNSYLYDMSPRLTSEVENVALNVMQRLLLLPSLNCQESALHGLNHWLEIAPERVATIIDEALDRRIIDPQLVGYARGAALGKLE